MIAAVDVLAYGPWRRGEIRLERVSSSRALVADVERGIETAWSEGLVRTPTLFDGPMCRLEQLLPSPDNFVARISLTSYKVFYGTNLYRPESFERFGPTVMANPIGLSAAVVTSDGFLVLGRRNQSVAYYPGRVHPFAGSLEPTDSDPFAGVERELSEELALTRNDIIDVTLLGVVEDRSLHQPEFVFRVGVRKTLADLRNTLDAAEHHEIYPVHASTDAVATAAERTELTPVAVGTLILTARAGL